LLIGSVSLFADSIDFLEDASVNFLIAMALRWGATSRARLGMILGGILLLPSLATLWTAMGEKSRPRRRPQRFPYLWWGLVRWLSTCRAR